MAIAPDEADDSELNGHETPPTHKIRLCVVATIGKTIQVICAGRLEYLTNHGFEVTVSCAPSELDEAIRARGVRLRTFPLTRAITPWQDMVAFVQMYHFFREERFDIVETLTPKASLIGSLAAWAARCPCHVHMLCGLAYEGKGGLLGAVLRASTWIPCRLAHVTFAVSSSVRQRVVDDGLGRPDRIRVLGMGSSNGVNIARVSPEKVALSQAFREAYRIAEDAIVIGFIGRLTRDKGVEELARVFVKVHEQWPNAVLLVVGDYEERDRPSAETRRLLATHAAVCCVPWQEDVLPCLAAMNMLVLPTYREGLPSVLLEAAAIGIPSVTTNATGARDAIVHGETGFRVPIGDEHALKAALATLAGDPSLRKTMGQQGRQWVCKYFNQTNVWQSHTAEYRAMARAIE